MLQANGYDLQWIRREPTMYAVLAGKSGETTSGPTVDPAATMTRLGQVLDEAEAFVTQMPTDKAGLLFLQAGNAMQPDPEPLETYAAHAGQRRGQWPRSPEIAAAMFERYNKKPTP